MDRQELFEETKQLLNNIKETDDYILQMTRKLDIVLMNLKIENAHIGGNTGIVPIANELNKIIKNIDEQVKELINTNRGKSDLILESLKQELNIDIREEN